MSAESNLKIWDQVCETDPAYTKQFSRAGGFRGTAVNQTYQVRRATELWGPIGDRWGFKELEHMTFAGADGSVVWMAKVQVWYPTTNGTGHVEQWGATTICGKNSKGAYTDEEAPKKTITDAVGKCLSLLGFSADIFIGLYDDDKYVAAARQRAAERKRAKREADGGGNDQPQSRRPNDDTAYDQEEAERRARETYRDHPNGNGSHKVPPPPPGDDPNDARAAAKRNGAASRNGNSSNGNGHAEEKLTENQRNYEASATTAIKEALDTDRIADIRSKLRDPRRGMTNTQIARLNSRCNARLQELGLEVPSR